MPLSVFKPLSVLTPGPLGGNGLERNRRQLQLLREDPCVIKDSAFHAKYADIFEKQTTILSWTWKIYGIQYVKVDIRTNKPLNGHFRFRLSCRLRYRYRHQTRLFIYLSMYLFENIKTAIMSCGNKGYIKDRLLRFGAS